jgi:signal transduction histidine kinase
MATTITVQLSNVAGKLVMEISDNGIGFDVNHKGRPDSFGLIGMKERIKLLGGNLDITSKVGEGTMVKVEIDYGKNLISLGKFPAARGKIKNINQS